MWTEEKLKEAAEEYKLESLDEFYRGKEFPMIDEAFLAGCKYVINNTQKE